MVVTIDAIEGLRRHSEITRSLKDIDTGLRIARDLHRQFTCVSTTSFLFKRFALRGYC